MKSLRLLFIFTYDSPAIWIDCLPSNKCNSKHPGRVFLKYASQLHACSSKPAVCLKSGSIIYATTQFICSMNALGPHVSSLSLGALSTDAFVPSWLPKLLLGEMKEGVSPQRSFGGIMMLVA